ncbi:MAG: hypothetical protein AMJ55_02005 [Gammaproteobacteria bacterium SG8_15]|nr:MAG: hypothetical protein AMJ55_02005 [Gammaproteobacteria bacterium SG8_15]
MLLARLEINYPGSVLPGRIMSDMLVMTTSQARYPITLFVLMKTDDCLLHGNVIDDYARLGNGHAADMPVSY